METTYRLAIEEGENAPHELEERIGDFTAFLIYFNQDDSEAIEALFEPYADLYSDLSDEYSESDRYVELNLKRLYQQLKLAGAWINQHHDTEEICPRLWEVLVEEVYEIPESQSRIPRSVMAEHGYPTGARSLTREGWWLRPDTLWSYTGFQEEISQSLNGDGSNYGEFHERLLDA